MGDAAQQDPPGCVVGQQEVLKSGALLTVAAVDRNEFGVILSFSMSVSFEDVVYEKLVEVGCNGGVKDAWKRRKDRCRVAAEVLTNRATERRIVTLDANVKEARDELEKGNIDGAVGKVINALGHVSGLQKQSHNSSVELAENTAADKIETGAAVAIAVSARITRPPTTCTRLSALRRA